MITKDGSGEQRRTTLEHMNDHCCGDHDDDDDDDDEDREGLVVPVLMCGGNKKSPSHPTLICQMLLTIILMIKVIINIW